jgi:hypothetical protein
VPALRSKDAAVRALAQRYHEARQQVADLDRALRVVDGAGGIEPADRGWDAIANIPMAAQRYHGKRGSP